MERTRKPISRRALIKASLGTFFGVSLSSKTFAKKPLQNVSLEMYADFGCPHCYKSFQMISPYISFMNQKGVQFDFLPILPATVTETEVLPEPIVRFFYSAKAAKVNNLTAVINSLFRGSQEKAKLHSFDSIYQWVMLSGVKLDYKVIKKHYETFLPRSKFLDALQNYGFTNQDKVPIFDFVKNNDVKFLWPWSGSAEATTQPVINYLKTI